MVDHLLIIDEEQKVGGNEMNLYSLLFIQLLYFLFLNLETPLIPHDF
jgi:hypothetical protein